MSIYVSNLNVGDLVLFKNEIAEILGLIVAKNTIQWYNKHHLKLCYPPGVMYSYIKKIS